ncbi:outer membrane lipoprotein chaperone LolA [Halioxenophilus aromaticivorans]|uniref:Outer-membrane lipoprotein carrier protein n=1 Tax=Halioxenophilus aromaticivorans TaxID=1306992 RepID=A0AAV3UAB9_9ALTE
MIRILLSLCTMVVLATAQPASANSESLVELLEPLVNGAGDFEQITYDSKGQPVQRSSGHFAVMKPGKFYWQTLQPYEQVLVSDAQTIWLYDPDLEQVTVKTFAGEQNQLPIRILSGDFDLIGKEFQLSEAKTEQGLVYHLAPNSASSNVASIDLTFVGQNLASMTVVDRTETKTQFVFSNRKALSQDDKNKFAFEIPEGADVFHDQPL